jgi:NAD(P)-dependent dehydrogenase (short-subunit alcohol dehydrogenase family)
MSHSATQSARFLRQEESMDLGLGTKTALVFGAGGGLGGAIARALATEGAKLAIADVNATALDQAASELKKLGLRCLRCLGTSPIWGSSMQTSLE